jgi:hypothetical protein
MTIGDPVLSHAITLSGSYLDIQPSGTTVWGIQNLYVPEGVTCEVYRTDGTNSILLYTLSNTLQLTQPMYASLYIYFRVKNISAGSAYLGYDGEIVKV